MQNRSRLRGARRRAYTRRMTTRQPHSGFLTVDEYLALENALPVRHEYVAGRAYAMSGTTLRHNLIASNIHACLRAAARGGSCQAYIIDIKLRAAGDRIYYPDGIVVCAPHAGDTLVLDDPCLVVEVTSRSTRRTDHGEKLAAYLGMPSLRAYLIAEHDRRLVTLHSREATGEWNRHELDSVGRFDIPCPQATLSLDEIYEGVEMPPLRVSEEPDEEDAWVDLARL